MQKEPDQERKRELADITVSAVSSTTDSSYKQGISDFFDSRIEGNEERKEWDVAAKFRQAKDDLSNLADSEKNARLLKHPHFLAEGLAILAGFMESPVDDKELSRDLFMKSCEKLYSTPAPLGVICAEILRSDGNPIAEGKSLKHAAKLATSSGKLSALAEASKYLAEFVENMAWNEEGDGKPLDTYDARILEQAVQLFYAIQLRIRELKEEQYNRTDVTEDEMEAVDTVRDTLGVNEALDMVRKDGGVYFHTSLPKKYGQSPHGGFQDVFDKKRLVEKGDEYTGRTIHNLFLPSITSHKEGKRYTELGINEGIAVLPLTEMVFKKEVVKKGGWLRKEVKKDVYKGERAVMHKEKIVGGKDEPAYRFVYMTLDHATDPLYKDYSNRPGQFIGMEVLLPESVAKKLAEKIKQNPNIAREIVEAEMIKATSAEAWKEGDESTHNIPLRPPYEQWKEQNRGKSNVLFLEKPIVEDPIKEGLVRGFEVS